MWMSHVLIVQRAASHLSAFAAEVQNTIDHLTGHARAQRLSKRTTLDLNVGLALVNHEIHSG